MHPCRIALFADNVVYCSIGYVFSMSIEKYTALLANRAILNGGVELMISFTVGKL